MDILLGGTTGSSDADCPVRVFFWEVLTRPPPRPPRLAAANPLHQSGHPSAKAPGVMNV